MLSRTLPENSSASGSTTPTCARSDDSVTLRTSWPSTSTRPPVDVVEEARDQVDHGRLAGAGGAEQRHHLARLDGEADAAQDLALSLPA